MHAAVSDLFGPPQQYNVLATLSSIGGKELRGYKYVVPSWCEEPTDPSLREVEVRKSASINLTSLKPT